VTPIEHAGVPISIVSKWAGHYDSAFTQETYVHASDDDLHQGRTMRPRFTRSLRTSEKL
jgi:integrase